MTRLATRFSVGWSPDDIAQYGQGAIQQGGRQGGTVNVSRDVGASSLIDVQWFCGEARRFSPDDLDALIDLIDGMREFPDVWLFTKSTQSIGFALKLDGNDLYVDSAANDDARSAPWDDLRWTLRRLTKPDREQARVRAQQEAEAAAREAEAAAAGEYNPDDPDAEDD